MIRLIEILQEFQKKTDSPNTPRIHEAIIGLDSTLRYASSSQPENEELTFYRAGVDSFLAGLNGESQQHNPEQAFYLGQGIYQTVERMTNHFQRLGKQQYVRHYGTYMGELKEAAVSIGQKLQQQIDAKLEQKRIVELTLKLVKLVDVLKP